MRFLSLCQNGLTRYHCEMSSRQTSSQSLKLYQRNFVSTFLFFFFSRLRLLSDNILQTLVIGKRVYLNSYFMKMYFAILRDIIVNCLPRSLRRQVFVTDKNFFGIKQKSVKLFKHFRCKKGFPEVKRLERATV